MSTYASMARWKFSPAEVIIHPSDLTVSRDFYENVLGLRLYHEYGDGDRVIGVVYFLGGGNLELAATPAAHQMGVTKLWLQVPDLDAEQKRLHGLGVRIDQRAARMAWGLIELHLRDPDDHLLTLVEVPEDHFLRSRL